MVHSNREILEVFFQALNRRDWDGVEGLVDDDYVWEMPQSGERPTDVPLLSDSCLFIQTTK